MQLKARESLAKAYGSLGKMAQSWVHLLRWSHFGHSGWLKQGLLEFFLTVFDATKEESAANCPEERGVAESGSSSQKRGAEERRRERQSCSKGKARGRAKSQRKGDAWQ